MSSDTWDTLYKFICNNKTFQDFKAVNVHILFSGSLHGVVLDMYTNSPKEDIVSPFIYTQTMETLSFQTVVPTFKIIMHYNPGNHNVTRDIKLKMKAMYILSVCNCSKR
jgi:hypothetical protein